MRILGIVGSLRRDSVNRKLLEQVREFLPADARLRIWDELAAVPAFDEDAEHEPVSAVVTLRSEIEEADLVLVVTPEYNGSIPGQLKNALDWASRPFPENCLKGKPALVIGASPSPGGTERAQAEARHVLTRIGALVHEEGVALPHAYGLFDGAALTDDAARERLAAVLAGVLTVPA